MPNPARIYVLHHPDSPLAADLADRIYDWFRLTSLQGIPVYVRSVAAGPDGKPPLPGSGGPDRNVLEYLIPLIDAHLVREPAWHDYLMELADECRQSGRDTRHPGGWVMFPVSLDSTAFNLPVPISRRNFIRHSSTPRTAAASPIEQQALDAEETLKHLTEALARDLNGRLFPKEAVPRFKIFISYSRADSADIARALRDYIQGETQCQVFLDQNDIGYGKPFDEELEKNVSARAMMVINSDSYADRPWCRWEIGNFTEPKELPLDEAPSRTRNPERQIQVFSPLLVVDAVKGPKMTRVVPELAQAPVVRWETGRAKLCFSVLMREVLLGLRDVLVARQVLRDEKNLSDALVVNRLPGPVALERLLRSASQKRKGTAIRTIHYPGNGLPLIELRLLERTFKGVRLCAFRDILRESFSSLGQPAQPTSKMRRHLKSVQTVAGAGLPLRGKVIAISTSHCPKELAALGYLPQHQDEALIHLLRPLLRMGADIVYGGTPPTATAPSVTGKSWSATRNITTTLLDLLCDERREDEKPAGRKASSPARRGSLLFNVAPWPGSERVTPRDEAACFNVCRILRITPEDAGLPAWSQPLHDGVELCPPGFRRYVALTLSALRRQLGGEFKCRVPGDSACVIRPAAFVFMGGKLTDFAGLMPGIMEEFLHASKTGRPIYLFGGLGGATGVIARALCEPGASRPDELKVEHYLAQSSMRKLAHYPALLAELQAGDPQPHECFDELWSIIEKHRAEGLDGLFQNGLSHDENKKLITTTDTLKAICFVWQGMSDAPGLLAPERTEAVREKEPPAK
jgi:hypothetical protein